MVFFEKNEEAESYLAGQNRGFGYQPVSYHVHDVFLHMTSISSSIGRQECKRDLFSAIDTLPKSSLGRITGYEFL
jgi:hypothetical protein